MALINVSDLTFCYEGSYDNIFENVSLKIDSDWKLGFIGRNGRGKTTFLKILSGKYKYQGKISSPLKFDYFPFYIKDTAKNTMDVLNELDLDFEFWKLCRELTLLKLDENILYQTFETLSMGERTKVLLAVLFSRDNYFLLIDEPTNHLDMEGRWVVSDYLNAKKGFILVSHDKDFLDNCVNHILSINKTNITVHKGDFTAWQINKELQDRHETEKNDKLKKDIKRLDYIAKRTATWSDRVEATKIGGGAAKGHIGRMAAKMMKRSKATEERRNRAVDEKSRLLKNIETADELSIRPIRYHNDIYVRVEDLAINYGDKEIFNNVGFTINRGDRVALVGGNGCGKTSLIKLILGKQISYKGRLQVGSNLIISTVSQDTSFLKGGLKDFVHSSEIDESLFKAILHKLDFSKIQFEKDLEDFSEGQKKKVLIARSLSQKANLYIWDEPLNYIDILSRMQIESLIISNNPTMLFVEHDSSFINSIATKIVEL